MISKNEAKELIATNLNEIRGKRIIKREETELLTGFMEYRQIIALSGIRRSGKTYILFQMINDLLNKERNVAYLNFENPKFDDSVEQLDTIYQAFLEYSEKEGKAYLFLDEIQNIARWEKWLAAMYEKNIKFFVSGSNASLLAGEFSKSLSGRHKLIKIYPLSFRQFISFKDSSLKDKKQHYITEKKARIKRLLQEYLHHGGFPEVVYDGRKDVLKDYFEDILTKDIIARHNIKFKQSLKELAYTLLTDISSLHSLYSLNKIIQARSINTIKNYLMFLEDAYIIIRIPFFSYSTRKQNANPFKIYCIDTGLRNAVSFRFSQDMGKIYENTAALHLIKKYSKENIFYWRNSKHEEVDFIVKKDLKISQLIQVSYDITNQKTKQRETRALINASKELKCNNLLIITEDYEAEEKTEWYGRKANIRFLPMWKWLLEE